MKSVILLLCLITFAPFAAHAYKHKSEAEIVQMTPAQRVGEYADELTYHKYDVLDDHFKLIEKYIWLDGLKALPHIIEIMDNYDPTKSSGKDKGKAERFDAAWMLLGDLDAHIVRIRASEQGRLALDALEHSIERMKIAGYGQPDQHGWKQHGRIESVIDELKYAKGINSIDNAIKETFRLKYKIILPDVELLKLSNFLATKYPEYPSWSEQNLFQDHTQINEAGNPLWIRTMKKPERYYEAYLEFKKTK